jgi:hypothetical protein
MITQLPNIDFSNKTFINELCNTIQIVCKDVKTINLASNNISTLVGFSRLIVCAPSLINLSLSSNMLSTLDELEYLIGYKDTMNELILLIIMVVIY